MVRDSTCAHLCHPHLGQQSRFTYKTAFNLVRAKNGRTSLQQLLADRTYHCVPQKVGAFIVLSLGRSSTWTRWQSTKKPAAPYSPQPATSPPPVLPTAPGAGRSIRGSGSTKFDSSASSSSSSRVVAATTTLSAAPVTLRLINPPLLIALLLLALGAVRATSRDDHGRKGSS